MKKVLKLVAILFSAFLIIGCSKPKITKEQQDNIATRIYRNYDIQEIEFLSFTRNESTGTYYLRIRLNGDARKETILSIFDLSDLEKSEGEMSLSPHEYFDDIKRQSINNDKLDELKIKITYIGGK